MMVFLRKGTMLEADKKWVVVDEAPGGKGPTLIDNNLLLEHTRPSPSSKNIMLGAGCKCSEVLALYHRGSISGSGPTGTTFALIALLYPSLYCTMSAMSPIAPLATYIPPENPPSS